MESQTEIDKALAGLEALKQQARREGKWLWCAYQDLWFSPDQLDEQNTKGSFRWGPVNWRLRDPQEKVAEAKRRVDNAQAEYERARQAVG